MVVLPKDKKYCIHCIYMVDMKESDRTDRLCAAVNPSSYVGMYGELQKCEDINTNGDCESYIKMEKSEPKPKPKKGICDGFNKLADWFNNWLKS